MPRGFCTLTEGRFVERKRDSQVQRKRKSANSLERTKVQQIAYIVCLCSCCIFDNPTLFRSAASLGTMLSPRFPKYKSPTSTSPHLPYKHNYGSLRSSQPGQQAPQLPGRHARRPGGHYHRRRTGHRRRSGAAIRERRRESGSCRHRRQYV